MLNLIEDFENSRECTLFGSQGVSWGQTELQPARSNLQSVPYSDERSNHSMKQNTRQISARNIRNDVPSSVFSKFVEEKPRPSPQVEVAPRHPGFMDLKEEIVKKLRSEFT